MQEMEQRGLSVDTRIHNELLKAHVNADEVVKALMCLQEMQRKNVQFNIDSYNIIISGLARARMPEKISSLVDRMKSVNADGRGNSVMPDWKTYVQLFASSRPFPLYILLNPFFLIYLKYLLRNLHLDTLVWSMHT